MKFIRNFLLKSVGFVLFAWLATGAIRAAFDFIGSLYELDYWLNHFRGNLNADFPRGGNLVYFFLLGAPFLVAFLILSTYWNQISRFLVSSFFQSANALFDQVLKIRIRTQQFRTYEALMWRTILIVTVLTFIFAAGYFALQEWADPLRFFELNLYWGYLYLLLLALGFLYLITAHGPLLADHMNRFLRTEGSAWNLAGFRVVIFWMLMTMAGHKLGTELHWTELPKESRIALPFMGWFILNVPISPMLFTSATYLLMFFSGLSMIGLFARMAMPLATLLAVYVIGVPLFYGKLFHLHIWVWFPAILAFSPCNRVLSLDSLIFRKKLSALPTRHAMFGLPLRLVWLHLGIIYFFAGVVKIYNCGFEWALGDNAINQMQLEWVQHYDRMPMFRVDHYPAVVRFGALGVVLFEIFYPLLILSDRFRIWIAVSGLAFHNMTQTFMYIGFMDLQKTYVGFFDWERIVRSIRNFKWVSRESVLGEGIALLKKQALYRIPFYIGLGFFSINLIFGLFRVHSWPFSSYPTYSNLAADTTDYLWMDAWDAEGNHYSVDSLAEAAGFRKESYTPFEDRYYEQVRADDAEGRIHWMTKFLGVYAGNIPEMDKMVRVEIRARTTPIAPESRSTLLKNELHGIGQRTETGEEWKIELVEEDS